MPQSPHHLRNDLKCVEWDIKSCSIQSNLVTVFWSRSRSRPWSCTLWSRPWSHYVLVSLTSLWPYDTTQICIYATAKLCETSTVFSCVRVCVCLWNKVKNKCTVVSSNLGRRSMVDIYANDLLHPLPHRWHHTPTQTVPVHNRGFI